jgi:hypothetical protein
MPPTRRRAPRRTALVVTGLRRVTLQLGPSRLPLPPEPGAWAAGQREAWAAVRDGLPRSEWPSWDAWWALTPGIPQELRLVPGLQAVGVDQRARRAAWLEAYP